MRTKRERVPLTCNRMTCSELAAVAAAASHSTTVAKFGSAVTVECLRTAAKWSHFIGSGALNMNDDDDVKSDPAILRGRKLKQLNLIVGFTFFR